MPDTIGELSGLAVSNHGKAACWLVGAPLISFGGERQAVVEDTASTGVAFAIGGLGQPRVTTVPSRTVLLEPGGSTGAAFLWSNWCGRRPTQVLVAFASGEKPIAATVFGGRAVPLPICESRDSPTTIEMSPWSKTT